MSRMKRNKKNQNWEEQGKLAHIYNIRTWEGEVAWDQLGLHSEILLLKKIIYNDYLDNMKITKI